MRSMSTRSIALVLLALGFAGLMATRDARAESTDLEVYGFAHFDYIQDFNRVNPDWAATLRASKIPTTDGLYGADGQAIMSARQSRLGVQGTNGDVYAKFEFDMFGVGGDEGQTTIRLRHAYGQYKGWLAGQTNTLFMDVDLFPNTIDYWGPAGMVFLRNPQLRWTKTMTDNSFAIAIEHPSNDVDAGQLRTVDPSLDIVSVSRVPDLTAQFKSSHGWGHFQVSGIVRKLGYETPGGPDSKPKGDKTGGGGDFALILKAKSTTTFRLGAVFGNGIANYMNDGGTDLAADGTLANPEAKAVPLQGYTAYVDHNWSPKVSTALGYSRTQVTNTSLQDPSAFHIGEYASVNVIYAPTSKVFFGAEGLWGQRTDNGGAIGDDRRIQFSAHYAFSSKNQ
jgi:hypothetical protein